MTMSPQDIQAKQFHVRFRGFDVEEVDGFLEQVAEHYLMALEENKTLTDTVQSLTGKLDALKNEEHSFKEAIISAQRVADDMRQKSKEQASALLLKAQNEAEELKDAAHKEITELEYQVDELRGMQSKLQADLKQLVGSYLEQIEQTFDSSGHQHSMTRLDAETAEVNLSSEAAVLPDDDLVAELPVGPELDTPQKATEEPELDDLYEKIDLGPDGIALVGESEGGSIPDLDDDVMFTLEDPLDKDGFDVVINPSANGNVKDDER